MESLVRRSLRGEALVFYFKFCIMGTLPRHSTWNTEQIWELISIGNLTYICDVARVEETLLNK